MPSADWTSTDSTEVLAHYPPATSLILAPLFRLGLSRETSGRILLATSAAITMWAVVMCAGAIAEGAALPAGVALLAFPAFVGMSTALLSDLPFCAVTMLVIFASLKPRNRVLIGSGAAVALLLRFVGISTVAAAAAVPLTAKLPWKTRIGRAMMLTVPSFVALALWLLYVRHARSAPADAAGGVVGARHVGLWTSGMKSWIVSGVATMLGFIVPPLWSGRAARGVLAMLGWVALVATAGRGILRLLGRGDEPPRRLVATVVAFSLTYLAVVVASRLVLDPFVPLDSRILGVLVIVWLPLVVAAARVLWDDVAPSRRRWLGLAGMSWLALGAAFSGKVLRQPDDWIAGLSAKKFRDSAALRWLATAPGGPVFSNQCGVVYLVLRRPCRTLPFSLDESTWAALGIRVRQVSGVAVVFHDAVVPLSAVHLRDEAHLTVIRSFPEADVWAPTAAAQ